ncbi:hypothetical protein HJB93_21485 [Rhizobium sp. NLR12b]|uniref:hypothetical protein n=1 Tax=Rhizobium sp. NLR12b TaxID=2731108 RepID=UPI001C82A0D7|nr:hypothetical protein [Rhizobium sp. NLR12b]MBX5301766.1 hypothetical protein [Rhizobium sp. NLR12b]
MAALEKHDDAFNISHMAAPADNSCPDPCFPGMAAATAPCRDNTLAKAKVVVEARVKSLAIGDPGLLLPKDYPKRVIRVDLEIEKVIKGYFIGKEATLYGIAYPPPERLLELLMSLATGTGGQDTFEWELSLKIPHRHFTVAAALMRQHATRRQIMMGRWGQVVLYRASPSDIVMSR